MHHRRLAQAAIINCRRLPADSTEVADFLQGKLKIND